jgi:hypothetical protein
VLEKRQRGRGGNGGGAGGGVEREQGHGKADRHMKLLTTETESSLGVHFGIKNSVRNSARRRNCGKQRKRRK